MDKPYDNPWRPVIYAGYNSAGNNWRVEGVTGRPVAAWMAERDARLAAKAPDLLGVLTVLCSELATIETDGKVSKDTWRTAKALINELKEKK